MFMIIPLGYNLGKMFQFSILFVGYRQTVQTGIRRRSRWCQTLQVVADAAEGGV